MTPSGTQPQLDLDGDSFWTPSTASYPNSAFIGHQSADALSVSDGDDADVALTILPPQPSEPSTSSVATAMAPAEETDSQIDRIPFPAQQLFGRPATTSAPRALETNDPPANGRQNDDETYQGQEGGSSSTPATKRRNNRQGDRRPEIVARTPVAHVRASPCESSLPAEDSEPDATSDDDLSQGREDVVQHNLCQWEAAENLVVNAIILRTSSDISRERRVMAEQFFIELAQATGERPRMVLERVRNAVEEEACTSGTPRRLVVSMYLGLSRSGWDTGARTRRWLEEATGASVKREYWMSKSRRPYEEWKSTNTSYFEDLRGKDK